MVVKDLIPKTHHRRRHCTPPAALGNATPFMTVLLTIATSMAVSLPELVASFNRPKRRPLMHSDAHPTVTGACRVQGMSRFDAPCPRQT